MTSHQIPSALQNIIGANIGTALMYVFGQAMQSGSLDESDLVDANGNQGLYNLLCNTFNPAYVQQLMLQWHSQLYKGGGKRSKRRRSKRKSSKKKRSKKKRSKKKRSKKRRSRKY